jgi:ribonuclease T1
VELKTNGYLLVSTVGTQNPATTRLRTFKVLSPVLLSFLVAFAGYSGQLGGRHYLPDVNQKLKPLFAEPPSQRRKQWLKIARYILLLLALAWLYSLPSSEVQPPQRTTPGKPVVSANAESRDGPRSATSNRRLQESARQVAPRNENRAGDDAGAGAAESRKGRDQNATVRNARVVDEDGRIIYRGDVDLTSTLDRIERGGRLRFSHDGIVFENREKRLPTQPGGYYHEYIHPTPDDSGPGGQRVIIGRRGEVYYTPDHYRTFRRVR